MTDEMMAPRSPAASAEPYAPSVEDADHAVQVPGAEAQAVGDEPGAGEEVRAGNGTGFPLTGESAQAQEVLEQIAAYCRTCPERRRCPESACAVYRSEAEALGILEAAGEEPRIAAGVPLDWSIV